MLDTIKPGVLAPQEVNVVIEISANSYPVKYEADKDLGLMRVDRFIATGMRYPCDYGYIPATLSDDGDPLDVLLIAPAPVLSGSILAARPIGMLKMTDESGVDAKILAVPVTKLTPMYQDVKEPSDIGQAVLKQIEHFFTHYKDLEEGKWVKVQGWGDARDAEHEIEQSIKRYSHSNDVITS